MSNEQAEKINKTSRNAVMGRRGGHGVNITDKPKHFKETLKRLLRYFRPYAVSLTVVYIIAALSTLFAVLAPKIMSRAINSIEETVSARLAGTTAPLDYDFILQIILILLGIYILSAGFRVAVQYIMAGVSQRILRKLRSDVQQKLTRLPLSYFDRTTYGEILSRAVGDVENIASTLQQSVVQLVTGMVTIAGVFIMMLLLSPLLMLVVSLTIPLYFFVARPIIKRAQKLYKKRQKSMGNLNGLIEEMYGGLKTVKAFGKEEETIKRFERINDAYCQSAWKAQFITGSIMPITSFLTNFSYVLTCVVSGILFVNNMISLGSVAAFLLYVRQFAAPVNQITSISNSIQASIASAERIFEILDEKEEDQSLGSEHIFQFGDVLFDHIAFRYVPEKPLIRDLTLRIEDGQTIAIVGPTGAGKTTLVNLLMRFYDVDSGRICVDRLDVREWGRNALRSQIGMVLQDTWLFNGSILENIRYGKDGATDAACVEAAKKAHAHHFISTLPDGYNTILNEEISNISQGEKQLITIARALLHDPKILILDEATSNVDTLTEQHIQDGMNTIMQNRTCFVIAHRLSTIKNADNILVMQDGDIVEMGNHEELLSLKGAYAELYRAQFIG